MYLGMVGSTAKQKKKRLAVGGGGAKSVSIATSSSGNFNNAVKVALTRDGVNFNYSNGVKDGSNSSFGTASSPTRTTQTVQVSASHYTNNANSAASKILIAGFIRNNNFTSVGVPEWSVATVSSSLSNSCTLLSVATNGTRKNTRDNTALVANTSFGIYHRQNVDFGGSGLVMARIRHGSGRGATSHPASGDTVTLRITATDQDVADSTTYTAIHDLTIQFVS